MDRLTVTEHEKTVANDILKMLNGFKAQTARHPLNYALTTIGVQVMSKSESIIFVLDTSEKA